MLGVNSVLKSSKAAYGYTSIVLASILWGTMGILAKLSLRYDVLPETLTALRLVVSSGTLAVILLFFRRNSLKIQKADVLFFVILGVFAVAFQRISYFYAVDFATPTVAAILFYTYPVFVTLLALFFLRERITFREVLGIVWTLLGVALVVKVYDAASLNVNFLGIIFGLLSSLLFVLYFFMTKKLRDNYASWTLTFYGDGLGALTLAPVISISLPQIVGFPLELWLLIFTIGWVPSLLAYLFYSYALKHVKASKGSILSVIEPLSATFFSAVILGESLEPLQMVGIAFALTGVVVLFWIRKPIVFRSRNVS
jgi:drug/metabolite transporter (DMT)-like permease